MYALWADRLNWPEWFEAIEEVGFREGVDDVCALNIWYRWGEARRGERGWAVDEWAGVTGTHGTAA